MVGTLLQEASYNNILDIIIHYVVKMFAAKMLAAKMLMVKILDMLLIHMLCINNHTFVTCQQYSYCHLNQWWCSWNFNRVLE